MRALKFVLYHFTMPAGVADESRAIWGVLYTQSNPALKGHPMKTAQFDLLRAVIQNNGGMLGVLNVKSFDGKHLLRATLAAVEPDNANDDARSAHTLELELCTVENGTVQRQKATVNDYVYYGDDPGDHLLELLQEGALLDYLDTAAVA